MRKETLYLAKDGKQFATVYVTDNFVSMISGMPDADIDVWKVMSFSLKELQEFAKSKGWMVTIT